MKFMSASPLRWSAPWVQGCCPVHHLAGALSIHWLNSFSYVGCLLSGICFTLQIHLSFSWTRFSLLLNGKAGDNSFRTYPSLEEWTVKGTRNSSTPSHRGLVTPLIGSHLWELLEPPITPSPVLWWHSCTRLLPRVFREPHRNEVKLR